MTTSGLSRLQAEKYIDRFGSSRVLVLGDIMLDRYFWGQVERISPEAPVPVVRVDRRSARLGGAANVAANLRALGVQVALVGTIADDRAGDEVRSMVESQGIDVDGVTVQRGGETTEKVRIIAQNQQVVRADFESDVHEEGEEMGSAISRVAEQCDRYDVLVVSDYGKGIVREGYLQGVIESWRGRSRPVLVDPHIGHFSWYRGASLVTPNTKEAASYFGAGVQRGELFETLGFRMRRELAVDALLITQGEEGMSLFVEGDEKIQIPTDAKEVYDVTGAGDTVISVLAAATASGAPVVEAVALANRAAGEVVKEVGTTAITRDKLLNAFL
jgi:D-beta-D-heptose 7-phosphate kinase/D-beta-D-heptose 1-phosphate adenosyltransferase